MVSWLFIDYTKQNWFKLTICSLSRSSVSTQVRSWREVPTEKPLDVRGIANTISAWWQRVPSACKLTRSNISSAVLEHVSKLVLINTLYHQSLCILYSSVVPLFSFTANNGEASATWNESAQIAFDHTCAISDLGKAILDMKYPVARLPSIFSYAAYSGSAILIPFMWCSKASVRAKVLEHATTNINIIQELAKHSKFAALMVSSDLSQTAKVSYAF